MVHLHDTSAVQSCFDAANMIAGGCAVAASLPYRVYAGVAIQLLRGVDLVCLAIACDPRRASRGAFPTSRNMNSSHGRCGVAGGGRARLASRGGRA